MDVEKSVRGLAAVAAVALVVAGCTPAAAPVQTPAPSVSQSPTESAQEKQQRLDYAAAEKSYRIFRDEYNRVLRAGGAKQPTTLMKQTAGDGYLAQVQRVSVAYNGFKYHRQGQESILSVKRGGYSQGSLILIVCEDTRQTKTLDIKGKQVGSGELRLNTLEAQLKNGQWVLWSGTGKKVTSCA